jgi:choline dehydrogenase-like flavoprotein
MAGLHPGAVIVLHDCRRWVLETLRIIGARFREKRYACLNLSELFRVALELPQDVEEEDEGEG